MQMWEQLVFWWMLLTDAAQQTRLVGRTRLLCVDPTCLVQAPVRCSCIFLFVLQAICTTGTSPRSKVQQSAGLVLTLRFLSRISSQHCRGISCISPSHTCGHLYSPPR
jgi:hypothetical protein